MGKSRSNSRPLRIAKRVLSLFQEDKEVSFFSIQKFLQEDPIAPITIVQTDWIKFMTEIGMPYFYNTDGVLFLRTDVVVRDFQDLVTQLDKSTKPHGELKKGNLHEGGLVYGSIRRGGRR